MKLPKWIRRTPKSNVGVKSIVKSSGHSSDGGGSQRHRRKSCSASLKGKRKRNSYVSSAITTKNFYPAEHFFKTTAAPSPAHLDGRGDDADKMAHYRTLPASFRSVPYQQGVHPSGLAGYYAPQQQQQQQQQHTHPLGLPNYNGPVRNRALAPHGMQLAQHYHPHNGMQYTLPHYQPNGMQLVQHHNLQKRLQQSCAQVLLSNAVTHTLSSPPFGTGAATSRIHNLFFFQRPSGPLAHQCQA
uniref:Uncharacterized protein n=1 Tax=Anopheles christyi TaxID=43041 RepID=A0A182K7F1_9DIPT